MRRTSSAGPRACSSRATMSSRSPARWSATARWAGRRWRPCSSLDWPRPDWSRIGGHFAALVHKARADLPAHRLFRRVPALPRRGDAALLDLAAERRARAGAAQLLPAGGLRIWLQRRADRRRHGVRRAEDAGPGPADRARPTTGPVSHPLAKPLPEAAADMPVAERIERQREALAAIVRPHVEAYGDRIFCPLSGGLDSAAAARRCCARPARAPASTSMAGRAARMSPSPRRSARPRASRSSGSTRSARTIEPDAFAGAGRSAISRPMTLCPISANCSKAAPTPPPAPPATKAGRCPPPAAAARCSATSSILPDRRMSAAAVARTFFARYAKGDLTEAFDERAFLRGSRTRSSPRSAGKGSAAPLPRGLIEQIYPRVRCRPFFGREISNEARFGAYLMPFLDHRVVDRGDDPAAHAQECRPLRGGADRRDRSGAGAASPPLTAMISPSRPTARIAGASSTPASARPGCARRATRSAAGWGRWRTSMAAC